VSVEAGRSYTRFQAKKLDEAAELRARADVAGGVGRSLHNLAPVVSGELRSIVQLLLANGQLKAQWDAAREAAARGGMGETDDELMAVAALLAQFATEAERRIISHANELAESHAQCIGKAAGIEEMVAEMAQETGDHARSIPEAVLGDESVPPPPVG